MNSQLLYRVSSSVVRGLHVGVVLKTTPKPSLLVDTIIRVDHAGELGANQIYAGQMAVLGNTKAGPLIQHMWDQEKVHKATFEELIVKYRVRPTALLPIWNVAGFLLGAGTALMGEKAAMACTVAVESVIVDHYNDQLRTLMSEPEKNKELMETIQKFRDDEQEHHDTGLNEGAEQAPFYKVLSEVIKFGCKTAITISKGSLSHSQPYNFNFSRNYSTSTKSKLNVKWDLYSAVCLERKPVILKPLNEFEKKMEKILWDLEVEASYKSDHEIQEETDRTKEEMYKSGKDLGSFATTELTAHEFEEISNKEFDCFRIAPRSTVADETKDVKSINRKLDSHLLLLVNEKYGNKEHWSLPAGIRKDSETMREAAERVLREKCGDKLNAWFFGNAPCGFYKYLYPKALKSESAGAKIFFFKALYISGQVELAKKNEYQWATRTDLVKLIDNKKYLNSLSLFLIEEDEVEER